MSCSCVKDLEGKIKEFLQPKVKAPIGSVRCQNIGWVLDSRNGITSTRLNIPFRVKADAPGYRSKLGKELMVHASYCPFCGASVHLKREDQDE